MANKFLEDSNGNKSSTRLDATVLLILICMIVVASFSFALFHKIADGKFIIELFSGLVAAFAACIAAGKLEKLSKDRLK